LSPKQKRLLFGLKKEEKGGEFKKKYHGPELRGKPTSFGGPGKKNRYSKWKGRKL